MLLLAYGYAQGLSKPQRDTRVRQYTTANHWRASVTYPMSSFGAVLGGAELRRPKQILR